ncbi:MAG: hypothetical protein KU37_08925 [Sulfuricurvum sp. PC08-66]|nr:MAG: hypothetical protein KU37_08925 [Sulfuricurvum sp. PC08-66]
MPSPIASLGMGSGAGLTGDTISKLRSADEKLLIAPIDKQLGEYEQKKASIEQLLKFVNQTKDFSTDLKEETLYLQRAVNVTGEGISATVEDGVEPQSINLTIQQIAKEHIVQSDAFNSKTASVADEDSELTIKIGDKNYVIEIKAGTQLRDLVFEINSRASQDVKASILQTGKDEFRLVLATANTGLENKIELVQGTEAYIKEEKRTLQIPLPPKRDPETGELLVDPVTGEPLPLEYETEEYIEEIPVSATKLLKNFYNVIQEPEDAKFTYNGAEITRASNKVDDMVVGLSFTLEQVTDENKRVGINITQDSSEISLKMDGFVKAYNELMANIDSMTKYDPENEEIGLFLGENTINSIRTNLNRLITQPNRDGISLAQMGVGFAQDGKMEFDQFAFEGALLDNPKKIENFFRGKNETLNGKDLQEEGLFFKISLYFDDLVNSVNGSISNFANSLDRQIKRTKQEKESAVKRLDNRYETMANQFAAADSAIGKFQKSFGAVDMQIKQSQASR